MDERISAADTLPKILRYCYQKYGDTKVAQRQKKLGRWKSFTWKEYYEFVTGKANETE